MVLTSAVSSCDKVFCNWSLSFNKFLSIVAMRHVGCSVWHSIWRMTASTEVPSASG